MAASKKKTTKTTEGATRAGVTVPRPPGARNLSSKPPPRSVPPPPPPGREGRPLSVPPPPGREGRPLSVPPPPRARVAPPPLHQPGAPSPPARGRARPPTPTRPVADSVPDLTDAVASDVPPDGADAADAKTRLALPKVPAPAATSADVPAPPPPPRPPGKDARPPGSFPPPPDDATRLDLSAAARRAVAALKGELPPKSREELAQELYDACDKELASKPDVHRTARLRYEMARLCEGPLGKLDDAIQNYELAHQLAKEHLPTLRGARRALVAAGKAQKALSYFDAEARLTSDPGRRAMLLYEKGLVLEDALGQHREAKAAFAAALELDETNPTLLKALERAQRRASAWDELGATYERAANSVSSDPHHRAALIAERARLVEARNKKPDEAIELYQTAISIDPHAAGAMAALKALLHQHGRWRDLIAVLEASAEQTGDEMAQALNRYAIARVHVDRLGNLDEAIQALESAAVSAPGEPLITAELARDYESARRWDKLVSALSALAERVQRPTEQVGIYHRIGQVAEERLGDEDVAIEWYDKCLAVNPAYLPALQALGKLRARRKEWTSLIAMHLAEAGATKDNDRRAAAHARVADVLETHLGKAEQAIEHHSRALGLVPGYPPSFKALSRLYFETSRHRELCELYERAIDLATDDETRTAYLFKVGRLQEDSLGAPRAALAAYQRILALSAKHVGAMHAIQRAAERARLWEELLESLDYEADRTMDRAIKVAILHRAGEVAEDHLGDDERALERYRKVTDMDPGYLPALSSLGRIYYRAGRWEDLLGIYRLELAKAPKGAESSALLYKMGELAEERVGREDEALRYYRQAVEADGGHAAARDALVRMLSAKGEFAEVVKLLQMGLERIEDAGDKARAALRIAEICEHRLGQVDRALDAYAKALGAVPDFRPALDGRARLLAQKRDYKSLAEGLAKEAETTKDATVAVAAKFREGEVWRDFVEQPKRAIEAFEAVLVRDPNHLGALLGLESLYAATDAWEALAQNFAAQARIFQNGFARAAALREQARVEEARGLRSPEELAQQYMAIIRMSPSDASALAVLERIGLATRDWALLAHVDAKLSALPDDPALVAAHETRLAESLESSGDASALDTFRSAISRDPENVAAASGVARLAERAQEPTVLAEAAEHVARVLRDPDRAAALLVQSARLHVQGGDAARAADRVERAVELNPDHAESAEALEELLVDAGDIAHLVDVLSNAAGAAKTRERRADLWVRVGALRAEREGDVGAGLAAIARALKEDPKHLSALMKQAELYSRDRQHKQAAEALEKVIAQKPEGGMLTVARVALARLLHDELGETERALSHLQKVLDGDPAHRGAIGLMLEVRVARGDGDDATALAQKLVEEARNDTERAGALRQLAALERKRGRRGAAAEALGAALEIAGPEVLDEFTSLLAEQAGAREKPNHRVFADALTKYLSKHASAPGLGPVHVALGRVQFDELGEPDRGLSSLRRGLELSGGDGELRAELAAKLMDAGHPAEAATELRTLLQSDPFRVEFWERLVEALRAQGKKNLADVALQPLVALGGGSDLDRVALQARSPQTARLAAGAFDASVLRTLVVSQPEDETTTALLGAVAPLLSKIYPAELESYGVTSRDKLLTRSGNPLRTLIDRIAQIFGVEDYGVYVHKAHKGGIEIEFEDDPAVMVPAHIAQLPQAEQAYLIARVFCDISRGLYLVHKLPQAEIAALLVAATRTVESSYTDEITEEARLGPLNRRVQKAMPWLGRRPVEDAARAYAPSQKPSLEAWLLRTRMTSARAGAIVADDLGAVVSVTRRLEGDGARDAAARKRGAAVLADTLRFAVDDSAAAIRKRVGLGG